MPADRLSRIDFYVISDNLPKARHLFVCRLAEKVFRLGHQVFVRASTQDEAITLDNLMWSFRAGSFLPHAILHTADIPEQAPLLIGYPEGPEHIADLLINLAPNILPSFRQFERIAEVVDQDAAVKEAGRQRYRFYREKDFVVETHNISVSLNDE